MGTLIHPIPYGETVTVHRVTAAAQDEYGNDVDVMTDIEISGVALWPRTASEAANPDTAAATRVVVGLTALIPPGFAVTATDRITARGMLYEVDGEPGVWRSYITAHDVGTEIALRRVEG